MKQALFSLIRPVLRRPVAEPVPAAGLRELDRAELRLVSGGPNDTDLPKTGW